MGTVRVSYDSKITSAVIDVNMGQQGYQVIVPDSRATLGTPIYAAMLLLSLSLEGDGTCLTGELTPELERLVTKIQNELSEVATPNRFEGQRIMLMRAFTNDSIDFFVGHDTGKVARVFSVPDELSLTNRSLGVLCGRLIAQLEDVFPTIRVGDLTEETFALMDQIAVIVDGAGIENT